MKFDIASTLKYNVNGAATFILNIQACHAPNQQMLSESLVVDPQVEAEEYTSKTGARFIRLFIPGPMPLTVSYKACVQVTPKWVDVKTLHKFQGLHHIDDEVIPFLFPSRYCESDKLYRFTEREFGRYPDNFSRVLAITNWVYEKIIYLSGSSNASTSATDTITGRAGVCRDFAHLCIAFCRALSIPARYFAGYAYKLKPQDFHACFEAFIGGEWLFFDATRMVDPAAMVKIAHGTDAADTSVASIFGMATFLSSEVSCGRAQDDNTEWENPGLDYVISYS